MSRKAGLKNASCPFKRKWQHMMMRCRDRVFLDKNPTYVGCAVCDEWLDFVNFKTWMESQDWEGNQLDKDLLVYGNKVYSPETCLFVSHAVNSFMTEHGAARGLWPIGVTRDPSCIRFKARCRNPFTKKQETIGMFDTPEEAHSAWKSRKKEFAIQLAAIQTNDKVAKALLERYS